MSKKNKCKDCKKVQKTIFERPCVDPVAPVTSGLCFTAGGFGLAALLSGSVHGDITSKQAGILTGLSAASIALGAAVSAVEVHNANRKYAAAVDWAVQEAHNAEIFRRIIASDLYRGERSFMKIVELLDGVSDADKENLRQRYYEYAEKNLIDTMNVVRAQSRLEAQQNCGTNIPQQPAKQPVAVQTQQQTAQQPQAQPAGAPQQNP